MYLTTLISCNFLTIQSLRWLVGTIAQMHSIVYRRIVDFNVVKARITKLTNALSCSVLSFPSPLCKAGQGESLRLHAIPHTDPPIPHNLRFTPRPSKCMECLMSYLYSAVTKRLRTISYPISAPTITLYVDPTSVRIVLRIWYCPVGPLMLKSDFLWLVN